MLNNIKRIKQALKYFSCDTTDTDMILDGIDGLTSNLDAITVWKNLFSYMIVHTYIYAILEERVDSDMDTIEVRQTFDISGDAYIFVYQFTVSLSGGNAEHFMADQLSFVINRFRKTPHMNISFSFSDLAITKIIHKETGVNVCDEISIRKRLTFDGTVRELSIMMERQCSLFNYLDSDDDKQELLWYLSKHLNEYLLKGDMVDIAANICVIIISSMTTPSNNGIIFHKNSWKFYYTHTTENTYDNIKSLPKEYLMHPDISGNLKSRLPEIQQTKIDNLIKLKGWDNASQKH